MKRILYILVIILLTGCRTSKTISTSSQMSDGHSSDSTAASTLVVDSASWATSNDSSVTASVHYDVLRDSVGQPVIDDHGAPVVYVTQRDTVWRVVTIDKGAHASIVQHDTVQVIKRDTLFVEAQYDAKTKADVGFKWIDLLCIVIIGIIGFSCLRIIKRKTQGGSGS